MILLRTTLMALALVLCGNVVAPAATETQSVDIEGDSNTVNQTINAIPPKLLERLLSQADERDKLAENIGVAKTAMRRFFLDIKEQNIPIEEWPDKLADVATRYIELSNRLARYDGSDPVIADLKVKARKALDAGDYRTADRYLEQAELRDLEIAAELAESADKRLLAAAETRAERAEATLLRFDYATAAAHFEAAFNHTPERDGSRKLEFLIRAGRYYDEAGQYQKALDLKENSVSRAEQIHGLDHPDVAVTLNNLAGLYETLSRYEEAEPLYKRSLEIKEKALGKDHPSVAVTLNNFAGLYQKLSRYEEAEPLYKRSLEITEKALGKDHPDVAVTLNNLAGLYQTLSRYEEAEPLYKRSLEIKEKALGKDHPSVAVTLNNLAILYYKLNKYEEALLLSERAVVIFNDRLPPGHPNIAAVEEVLTAIRTKLGQLADTN